MPERPPNPSLTHRLTLAVGFLLSALPLGTAAFALLVAGWTVTLTLAVTPLVVPALLATAAAVRGLARLEAGVARGLLGVPVTGPVAPIGATGWWRRGRVAATDAGVWRAQAYLALRVVVGWPVAVVWASLVAVGLQGVAAPLTYRWIPARDEWGGVDLGLRRIDTVAESFVLVPVGLAVLVVALALALPLASWWKRPALALLEGNMGTVPVPPPPTAPPVARPTGPPTDGRPALVTHALVSAAVGIGLVTIWALTTRGSFWPVWPLLALSGIVGVHAVTVVVAERAGDLARRRVPTAVAVQAGLSGVLVAFLMGVWLVSGGGYVWPVWVALGLGLLLGLHWSVAQRVRIDHLETARTDAVEVQETDLRRIERDLHDGAQARLVALGMHLGLAEQKMADDPVAARQLVTEARHGVGEALQELRDLVRGIRPPVLADRGLEAAIAALADRSPVPVEVVADVHPRPADAVETAAYFVVAESLANAAKHAGASRIDVRLERRGPRLHVAVTDDGRGAADPHGSGLSGLRRRVEALDGTLRVTSPAGGPTTVHAELPCGS